MLSHRTHGGQGHIRSSQITGQGPLDSSGLSMYAPAERSVAMDQYRIPSLARACEMLELFVDAEAPLSSSEVARRMRIPRTTALRILLTLAEQGLLARSGNGFEPGSKLFRLGIRALSSLRLRQFAMPVLQRLAADLAETTQLVTLAGLHGLVLDVCDGPRLLRIAQ